METLEKRKIDLRKQMKVLLKGMEPEEKARLDHEVYVQALNNPLLANAEKIYAYMALSWETGTSELLEYFWNRGVKVAFPKVLGSEMEFFEVSSLNDLECGTFRIMEPKEHCQMVDWPEAVIMVPGIAFTRDGKRLGKGGGYYDKYLDRYPGHRTAAFAYEFQMVLELPAELHDQPVDVVITEKGSFFCK
ncbi:MAG: 5-formyltetrahydrofolate cyclo-ligase [Lachnoclostridium sp.]|nr:5-formyltetrahydrofolate cyclo-ligase [Lachnoclostridium sp.]